MCLAIPGKIIKIDGNKATVDFNGVRRKADVSLLEGAKLNDFVLVHVGFAIQIIDESVAKETYRLLDQMDKNALEAELKK